MNLTSWEWWKRAFTWAPPEITQGMPLRSYERRKGKAVDQIVLHESVTWEDYNGDGICDAVAVLNKRKLGVHLVVHMDGSITQHVPLDKSTPHGGGAHNARSVGVEVVNRYYGYKAKPGMEVFDAVWAHKGRYIWPPAAQLEAVWWVVRWLTKTTETPILFPGCVADVFHWGRIENHTTPGVMAHHRWAHADGLVPEHYCLLRSRGFDAERSYTLTKAAAASEQRKTRLPNPGPEEAA